MQNIETISSRSGLFLIWPSEGAPNDTRGRLKQHSGRRWTGDGKSFGENPSGARLQQNQSRLDGTGLRTPVDPPVPPVSVSTLHRYSIGCSLSHTQSQCWGEGGGGNHCSFCLSVYPWKQVLSGRWLQVLCCVITNKITDIKKPFTEVIESPTSVLIGPSPGVKGHSAMTTEAAVGRPQSSSFFLPTLSWSRPLRLRMKPVKPSSCGGRRQIHHFTTGSHLWCLILIIWCGSEPRFKSARRHGNERIKPKGSSRFIL